MSPVVQNRTPAMQYKAGPRSYSSTQLNLPEAVAAKVIALGEQIPDADLAGDGREDDIHITCKYGLHAGSAADVAEVVRGFGPVHLTLGKVSLFPAKSAGEQRGGADYDVVKIDVDSECLHRLNQLLCDHLDYTDSHPRYVPHVTVAYVKPGRGKKYEGMAGLDGLSMTLSKLTFADQEGHKTTIDLTSDGAVTQYGHESSNVTADMLARRQNAAPQLPNQPAPYGFVVYHGPHGGVGWKDLATGKVIYATSGRTPFHQRMRKRKQKGNGRLHPAILLRHQQHLLVLARWYADHWNALVAAGQQPSPEELKEARLELHGSGVEITQGESGKWQVVRENQAQQPSEPQQVERDQGPVQFADEGMAPELPAEPPTEPKPRQPKPTMESPKEPKPVQGGPGGGLGGAPKVPHPVVRVGFMGPEHETPEHKASHEARLAPGPVDEPKVERQLEAAHPPGRRHPPLTPDELTALKPIHQAWLASHGEGAHHRFAEEVDRTHGYLQQQRDMQQQKIRQAMETGQPWQHLQEEGIRQNAPMRKRLMELEHLWRMLKQDQMTPKQEKQPKESRLRQMAGKIMQSLGFGGKKTETPLEQPQQQPSVQQPGQPQPTPEEFPVGSKLWYQVAMGNSLPITRRPDGTWEVPNARLGGMGLPHDEVVRGLNEGQVRRAQYTPVQKATKALSGLAPIIGETPGRPDDPRHAAFRQAIAKNPADSSAALVYADWLEGHDDPRGAPLREFASLSQEDRTSVAGELGLLPQRPDDRPPFVEESLSAQQNLGQVSPERLADAYVGRVQQARDMAERLQNPEDDIRNASHEISTWPKFQQDFLAGLMGVERGPWGYLGLGQRIAQAATSRRASPEDAMDQSYQQAPGVQNQTPGLANLPGRPPQEPIALEPHRLPPMREIGANYTGPLERFTPSLYREANIQELLDLDPVSGGGFSGPLGSRDLFFSNTPNLALGQGENAGGVLMRFNSAGIRGQVNMIPGWDFAWSEGNSAEFRSHAYTEDQLRANLEQVIVQHPPERPRQRQHLEQVLAELGLVQVSPGVYRRPDAAGDEIAPTVPQAQPPSPDDAMIQSYREAIRGLPGTPPLGGPPEEPTLPPDVQLATGVTGPASIPLQGDLAAPRPLSVSAQAAYEHIHKGIQFSPSLTPEGKAMYERTIQHVLGNMSDKAHARIAVNTKGGFVFAESGEQLRAEFIRSHGFNPVRPDQPFGGGYVYGEGIDPQVFIDGRMEGKGPQLATESAIAAHELGHVLNGPGAELVGEKEWQDAYFDEIADGQLSNYASATRNDKYANLSEGFAEFSRLLHGSDWKREDIAKKFPKALAFWQQRGLVQGTEGQADHPASQQQAMEESYRQAMPATGHKQEDQSVQKIINIVPAAVNAFKAAMMADMPVTELYKQLQAADPNLTPAQFRALMADLHNANVVRLTGWSGPLARIPDKSLAIKGAEIAGEEPISDAEDHEKRLLRNLRNEKHYFYAHVPDSRYGSAAEITQNMPTPLYDAVTKEVGATKKGRGQVKSRQPASATNDPVAMATRNIEEGNVHLVPLAMYHQIMKTGAIGGWANRIKEAIAAGKEVPASIAAEYKKLTGSPQQAMEESYRQAMPATAQSNREDNAPAAKVEYENNTARRQLQRVFGRDVDDQQLAAMTNAGPGSTVTVRGASPSRARASLFVTSRSPDGTHAERTFERTPEGLVVTNDHFALPEALQGRGLGLKLFRGQVDALQKGGVTRIETEASGHRQGTRNGYYTWPLLGFSGTISDDAWGSLPEAIKSQMSMLQGPDGTPEQSREIRDLFDLSGGREAWREHGSAIFDATFDLTPGSRNMKALEAYEAEVAQRPEQ